MQYIIMLLIVIGLALADYITGIIKAYCTTGLISSRMRRGGLNKLCELVVMCTACGLDIGIRALGVYYDAAELSGIAGSITAGAVFGYIVIMEIVSILENYGEIDPAAAEWTKRFISRMKNGGNEK